MAERSQHMQGKAIDAHFLDIRPAPIRDIAMRMQEGGVGFYPIGSTPWVHIDSGTVRYWPRMSRSALARLFPDGKTVFIPADGQPMDRYAEAKAMIESRGGDVQTTSSSGNLLSWLFGGARGGGADDEEETGGGAVNLGGRGGPIAMAGGRGGAAPCTFGCCGACGPCRFARAGPALRTVRCNRRCGREHRNSVVVARSACRCTRRSNTAAQTCRVRGWPRRHAAAAETAVGVVHLAVVK